MNQSDEIKGKLDIVEVLRDYISLKPAGSNFRALCPFHGEKSPSLMVSPEKQIWHCFGCGRGGDVFKFIMEMEGLEFYDTLKLLAPKAGVTLKSDNTHSKASNRSRLMDATLLAVNFYHQRLLEPKAKGMLDYLINRGLTLETIKTWKIGYSPESWDDLLNFLRSKNYTDQEIFLAGLSIKKEGSGGYFNRFRDRIMFPISDAFGNPIAFTARISPNASANAIANSGKYVNSPQTEIYDKSKVVFALDKARAEIKQKDEVIVVEGQMDAIACHTYGFKNVVASSGTALTAEQIKILKRYTNTICLSFDSDAAGQLAADRGIAEALAAEINTKVLVVSGYKDPDECLQKNPKQFQQFIDVSQPVMEYYLDKIMAETDDNPESKRRAVKKAIVMMLKMKNQIEIDHWVKNLAERIGVSENVIRESLEAARHITVPLKENLIKNEKPIELSREDRLSSLILALVLKFPEAGEYVFNNLEVDKLTGEQNIRFYNQLIIYYNQSRQLAYPGLKTYFSSAAADLLLFLDLLVMLAENEFGTFESANIRLEASKLIAALNRHYFKQRMDILERLIMTAEKSGNHKELEVLMRELQNLAGRVKEI